MMRRRLSITGQVQGVYYCGWFVEQTRDLCLDGWIRNRADGSVEAVLAGSPEALKEMVMLSHQGPPAARVEKVLVDEDETGDPLTGFAQRATV